MVVPRGKKDIEDVGRRLPGVLLSGIDPFFSLRVLTESRRR